MINPVLAIGYGMIVIPTIQIYRMVKRSVIIRKDDFQRIENKIRLDERNKTLEECKAEREELLGEIEQLMIMQSKIEEELKCQSEVD